MSLSVDNQSAELEHRDHQSGISSLANASDGCNGNLDLEKGEEAGVEVDDEEEEEDVDFNPFLVGETPSEASSSLSSEDEGLGDYVNATIQSALGRQDVDASPRPTDDTRNFRRDSGNDCGEVVMQTRLPAEGGNGEDAVTGKLKKKRERSSDTQQGNGVISPEGNRKGNSSSDEMDAVEDTTKEEPSGQNMSSSLNLRNFASPVIEINDEDAICRRTRARHSLANYTLPELEMFLQESDDDDNLQNADEEEEYHKFLAAVLLGGDDDGQAGQETEIFDEDEETDADFEIEIEEALESEVDESVQGIEKHGIYVHRPETRQKRSHKDSAKNKEKLLGQAKMPLRPILPSVSNAQVAPPSSLGWNSSFPYNLPHCSSLSSKVDVVQGFTSQQVGQLYFLIHEHVQLLLQVFSLCVLDPSRQHIASVVQQLISEMVDKREESIAWRKVPYPASFFTPLHVQQSVPVDLHQPANGSPWAPVVSGSVVSILDVASLRLARGYMTDVSATVLNYRRSQVESVQDRVCLIKEPLFPLPSPTPFSETSNEVLQGGTTSCPNTVSPLPACQLQPKKSLAASLVESTKKQSVALVPKDIAKLAQRFFPLFNSELFPHKPPRPPITNRVLFTDAEDGLLAMGLMEYNNDWAAIQQRFLPCKSKHQIFVRQKNRSSSKALENPIKAVRRMKTSPLTADEKALICEGLRIFKNDWMSVWKCFVPHRDPSLLPRQWRIATGTQKSYRKDEAVNEKRRLYEAKRRMFKASMTHQQSFSEKVVDGSGENITDDFMDDEDEAYVHEAFLADLEPGTKLQSASNQLPSQRISGRSKGKVDLAPYQMDITTASKVVKLAPDLPPVNLPPSVRVISQSAFKSYHSVSSYSVSGDSATKTIVPSIPHAAKAGTSPVNSEKYKSMLYNEGTKNDHTDHHATEENNSESVLQMHPLLFQASEDGCPPYLPKNCGTVGSSTYNIFAGHPLQANLNLCRKPQFCASVVDCSSVPHSKEQPLNIHTIDFHPLLQRTVNVNGDSVLASPDDHLSEDSESLQGGCANFLNSSDCVLSEPRVNGGQPIASIPSISQYEKENDLDLDIHLYSATNKEKTTGGRKMTGHKNIGSSSISILGDRMVEKAPYAYLPSQGHKEKCHEIAIAANSTVCVVNNIASNHESRACPKSCVGNSLEMALPSNSACQRTEDNLRDHPFPEIVMEQEELSDSDEEIENVEFECEEMDDSEAEGLDDVQPSENCNQEVLTTDKVHEVLAENLDGRRGPRPRKSGSLGKGESLACPLQSCPDSFTGKLDLPNHKQETVNRYRYNKVSPDALHSRPSRSNKKQNKKGAKLRSLETPQLHLYATGECNDVASRKPRKYLQK